MIELGNCVVRIRLDFHCFLLFCGSVYTRVCVFKTPGLFLFYLKSMERFVQIRLFAGEETYLTTAIYTREIDAPAMFVAFPSSAFLKASVSFRCPDRYTAALPSEMASLWRAFLMYRFLMKSIIIKVVYNYNKNLSRILCPWKIANAK